MRKKIKYIVKEGIAQVPGQIIQKVIELAVEYKNKYAKPSNK